MHHNVTARQYLGRASKKKKKSSQRARNTTVKSYALGAYEYDLIKVKQARFDVIAIFYAEIVNIT